MNHSSLYHRLGGYDGISTFASALLIRLQDDAQLGRFWASREQDSIDREKQLLIDFLCASTSGPICYGGRDMKSSHKDMQISESDWETFLGHAGATLKALKISQQECDEVVGFVLGLRDDIVTH